MQPDGVTENFIFGGFAAHCHDRTMRDEKGQIQLTYIMYVRLCVCARVRENDFHYNSIKKAYIRRRREQVMMMMM